MLASLQYHHKDQLSWQRRYPFSHRLVRLRHCRYYRSQVQGFPGKQTPWFRWGIHPVQYHRYPTNKPGRFWYQSILIHHHRRRPQWHRRSRYPPSSQTRHLSNHSRRCWQWCIPRRSHPWLVDCSIESHVARCVRRFLPRVSHFEWSLVVFHQFFCQDGGNIWLDLQVPNFPDPGHHWRQNRSPGQRK